MENEKEFLTNAMIKCEEIWDKDLFINGKKENVILYKDLKPGDAIDKCAWFFLNLRIPEYDNNSIMVFVERDLHDSIGNELYTKDRILDIMNLGEFPYYYEDNSLYFKIYYSGIDPNKVIYLHFDDKGNMDYVNLVKIFGGWNKGSLL